MAGVVVFSATWCSPCKDLKERIRKAGVPFRVVDVDAPEGERLSNKLGVRSIPAVFIRTGDDYVRVANPGVQTIRAALARHSGD